MNQIRIVTARGLSLSDQNNITWKKGLPLANGGWDPHSDWTEHHTIVDDDIETIDFNESSMELADLKFSVVTNGYRCMDHLFQNIYDHITKMLRNKNLFKTSCMDHYFDVC